MSAHRQQAQLHERPQHQANPVSYTHLVLRHGQMLQVGRSKDERLRDLAIMLDHLAQTLFGQIRAQEMCIRDRWYVVRLQNLEEQRDARRFAQRTYRVSGRCLLYTSSRLFTALSELPDGSMRQISEPSSTTVFRIKESQVEAFHHSGAPCIPGICRILSDLAQARLGCLSIEAMESSISLVICI